MVTWTIPTPATPPTPTATSTDAQWTNYLAYVREMSERDRFTAADKNAQDSTAAQNARATAEQAVASAGQAQAQAMLDSSAAMVGAMPPPSTTGVTVSEATLLELMKQLTTVMAALGGKPAA